MYILEQELSESVSPFTPGKIAYRKDDYTANCPDLIEPCFTHAYSHYPPPAYGLPENFVWLIVFCGRERIRTEQIKNILWNKSHRNCISFSKEVITVIYSVEEYAILATIFIIIINNTFLRNERVVFSFAYIIYKHNQLLTNAPTNMCFLQSC